MISNKKTIYEHGQLKLNRARRGLNDTKALVQGDLTAHRPNHTGNPVSCFQRVTLTPPRPTRQASCSSHSMMTTLWLSTMAFRQLQWWWPLASLVVSVMARAALTLLISSPGRSRCPSRVSRLQAVSCMGACTYPIRSPCTQLAAHNYSKRRISECHNPLLKPVVSYSLDGNRQQEDTGLGTNTS